MIRWMTVLAMLAAPPALFADDQTRPASQPEEKSVDQQKPTETQPQAQREYVELDTTLGKILLELNAERAPISVANFLAYVDSGYYNGTIFHRVMSNFMIQGGGYTPDLEKKTRGLRPPIQNEWRNGLKNVRGTIAMARTRDPNSATSQFFINVVDNAVLDQPRDGAAYAVFGKVVAGMDVVDKIRYTAVKEDAKLPGMGPVVPVTPVIIESAKRVTPEDAREMIRASHARRAQIDAEVAPQIKESIAKVEQETGKEAQRTPNGLLYVVLKEGEGSSPQPADQVELQYTAKLADGTVVDSSRERDKPAVLPLRGAFAGLTEGVSMMKPGGRRILIVPPDLAFGDSGNGPIPPNAVLVIDVELLSIK
jgi:peptidyl-prolyl cis-trans isomerase A (cyclophilin A)